MIRLDPVKLMALLRGEYELEIPCTGRLLAVDSNKHKTTYMPQEVQAALVAMDGPLAEMTNIVYFLPMTRRHRVTIIAYKGCQLLDVTGPAAVFGAANEALGQPFYEVAIASPDGGAVVTNCGVALTDRPAFSVQHHPEASPGPQDSHYLFKRFTDMMDHSKSA